jgi:Protein of unknown function (DUF1460)
MLLSLFAVTLLAAAPILDLTPQQLDEKLAEVQATPNVGDRIDAVSRLFLGLPYTAFPLGEGGQKPEPQPRFRLDGVDCQTYVETVLALVNAGSRAKAELVLDDIRYWKEPISFANRAHFTEAQWLPSLEEKGYLRDEIPTLWGGAPAAELVLKRAQWSQVSFLQRLIPADIPEGRFPIKYLGQAELRRRAASIEPGSIILVVREADPKRVVRVTHMGFVVKSHGTVVVRHASSAEGHVVEEALSSYLSRMGDQAKWKVTGYGLYAPLDARARTVQVTNRKKAE